MANLIELNAENFAQEVEQSDVPVLVDYWASWCGPCRMITPILEELSQDVGDKFKIAKVNVDEHQDLAAKFGVRSLPTLLFFKGGEVKDTVVGAGTPKAGLLQKLEALA
tara:strand:- start:26732 stop:27058 length:327 start_codon:yes stop_codon:yes gene_type:complete